MTSKATMRTFLREIIGGADAQRSDPVTRRAAIQDKGLQVITDLVEFDEDGIKSVCSSVRKLGGLIDDPNNPGQHIVNPGFNLPEICEKRLKLACYTVISYGLIGRTINQDGLSQDRSYLDNTGN